MMAQDLEDWLYRNEHKAVYCCKKNELKLSYVFLG